MATALDTTASVSDQQIRLASEGNQYLTFVLGEEHYGVDILRVQEIKGYTAVTRIPNTPAFIKGVLNLRGSIVPIVDLRAKFGMEQVNATMFTVIVVVVVKDHVMGVVVDAVSDVLDIAAKELQPAPNFGAKVDTSFIYSIAQSGDKLITLLDIDRVLSTEDIAQTAVAASQTLTA
ncbi:MAG: chemotaxis protein CheW [Nitrospira sp.]|nr:chemotaxis protein CheW [Nitrospira sp.]